MSRYHRRVRDDLVDVVFDVIRSAAPDDDGPMDEAAQKARAEREAQRQAAKAEARRQRELRGVRSFVGTGAGLLVGGLTFPLIGAPAAVGAGLLAGGLTQYVVKLVQTSRIDLRGLLPNISLPRMTAPRRKEIAPPEVDGRNLVKSQRDLVQGVLDEAAEHLTVLEKAANDLRQPDPDAAELCRRLVASGEKLSDAIADAPTKFAVAQRALTYYVKEAALTAQRMCLMTPDTPAAQDLRHVLARIEMFFEKTLLNLHDVDAAAMDLDTRLLNQSLDEDLKDDK